MRRSYAFKAALLELVLVIVLCCEVWQSDCKAASLPWDKAFFSQVSRVKEQQAPGGSREKLLADVALIWEHRCRDIHVIGSSGGACAASYLFLDVDVGKTVEYICDCASYARSHWLGPLKIKQYVRGAVRNFSPPDAGALFLKK